MTKKRDTLYSMPREQIEPFRFDAAVAAVFRDMIERSVPGYQLILEMVTLMARQFAVSGSRCYDLGCSLGDSTRALADGIPGDDVELFAVDSSVEMIAACRENLEGHARREQIVPVCADILATDVADASLVVMNFTLQFIPPGQRRELLSRIARGTRQGGVLLLSEKVVAVETREQETHESLHESFKRARGYSELEIAQKRAALDEVLIPESISTHTQRLLDAGYSDCWCWFQCLDFISLLAIR